ncbi:hypothetical protein [Neisseria subflava]|uniref:hypothetical protein n=1 Tax=Neisseria subflava TaxID=28449 RepID=UPI000D307EB4|nr:hypothetical protein [Neisseria subflava]
MQNTYTLSGSPKAVPSNTPRYRLTKLGEQMACLPIDLKIPRIFYGVPFWVMSDLQDIDDEFQELVVA